VALNSGSRRIIALGTVRVSDRRTDGVALDVRHLDTAGEDGGAACFAVRHEFATAPFDYARLRSFESLLIALTLTQHIL